LYLESEHVRIENNNLIINEYILERKEKINSIEHFSKKLFESGNRYFEIKGYKFILYRNNIALYTIENIITDDNEYGLFTFYEPKFYRRKDFPEMGQNEKDRIIYIGHL
jgi:hypothetical protein